jgi:DNA-binding CsgD family transcriptional regulator
MSSEGIGLDMGISINTVRTYRKRAYARLGICSQNELMRLVLPHLPTGAQAEAPIN